MSGKYQVKDLLKGKSVNGMDTLRCEDRSRRMLCMKDMEIQDEKLEPKLIMVSKKYVTKTKSISRKIEKEETIEFETNVGLPKIEREYSMPVVRVSVDVKA